MLARWSIDPQHLTELKDILQSKIGGDNIYVEKALALTQAIGTCWLYGWVACPRLSGGTQFAALKTCDIASARSRFKSLPCPLFLSESICSMAHLRSFS